MFSLTQNFVRWGRLRSLASAMVVTIYYPNRMASVRAIVDGKNAL